MHIHDLQPCHISSLRNCTHSSTWESKSRVVATCRSHALYASIISPLQVGVPALLARLTYGHDALNIPGFRICRRDVRTLFQVTA